jgi:hypothetical protein
MTSQAALRRWIRRAQFIAQAESLRLKIERIFS